MFCTRRISQIVFSLVVAAPLALPGPTMAETDAPGSALPEALETHRSTPRVDNAQEDLDAVLRGATPRSIGIDPGATPAEDPSTTASKPRSFSPAEMDEALRHRKEALARKLGLAAGRAIGRKTPVEATLGGDDVLIMSHQSIAQEYAYDIAISEGGLFYTGGYIYVAVQVLDPVSSYEIQVYRSLDGGDSWDWFGERRSNLINFSYRKPSLHIAEGEQSRLYLAYEFVNANGDDAVNVATCDLNGANAVWTVASAFAQPGVDFRNPDLSSDAVTSNRYRLYIVAEEDDGAANDIWFARSADFGGSWEPEYEIGTLGGNTTDYYKPKVVYGVGGNVHVAWHRGTYFDENVDDGIRYRRASGFAGGGIGAWDPVEAVTSSFDGFDEDDPTVAAQHASSQVVLNFTKVPDGGGLIENVVLFSDDAGETWDPTQGSAPVVLRPHVVALPGSYCFWGSRYIGSSYGFATSLEANPASFQGPEVLADDTYFGFGVVHQSMSAFDPEQNNRIASIWSERTDGVDRLWFDAEWRADPGYPNHNPNFPVALSSPPVTPPALADIDNEPRFSEEIVFGDANGDVHVFDRFGKELPGFPVSTGENISDESLAVGDLDGNGFPEIVVGTDTGKIYCWDYRGKLVPGWPRDIGSTNPVYVCIGTVSKLQARDVVATSGRQIHVVRFDGSDHEYAPFPVFNPESMDSAAALGDLDGDGRVEIVIAAGDKMRVYDSRGNPGVVRTMAGTDLRNTPSLGDLDVDGDLEIVVPTDLGQVWAFEHNGPNFPLFPYDTGVEEIVQEVSLADVTDTPDLELGIARRDWTTRLLSSANLGLWLGSTTPGWWLLGQPILDEIDTGPGSNGELIIGDRGSAAQAKYLFGSVPGWPKSLGDQVNVSPASGDIDLDGKVEVVFLTDSELVVLDVNNSLESDGSKRWPMYGHDAQRTNCANCQVDTVTGLEPSFGPSSVSFAAPWPNPSSGNSVFSYQLQVRATVSLDVFDARGRRVRTLVKEEQEPGDYQVGWSGEDNAGSKVSSGQYFGRLLVRGGTFAEQHTRKLVITH